MALSAREAILHAASIRLRPVLMTALTTLFALAPAAVTTPLGSRIFRPCVPGRHAAVIFRSYALAE